MDATVAIKSGSGYYGTNAVFMGDRIAPQTTEIKNGEIIVNFADRRADEPFTTAPSVGKSLYLKMDAGELVSVNKDVSSGEEIHIEGSTFHLASYNGKSVGKDKDYILKFENGIVGAQFCTTLGGKYTLQNGIITSVLSPTGKKCSFTQEIVDIEGALRTMLGMGASVSQKGNTLTLKDSLGEELTFNL